MLTKEQAAELAQSIIESKRLEKSQERERKARGAPIGLRVASISELPKQIQDRLVQQAYAATRESLFARVAVITWGLTCLTGWLIARQHWPESLYFAVLFLSIGSSAIFTISTRRKLREMVSLVQQSSSASAA
jgi:hypothetical protein